MKPAELRQHQRDLIKVKQLDIGAKQDAFLCIEEEIMTDMTKKVPVQKTPKPLFSAQPESLGAFENLRRDVDRLFDNVGRGLFSLPTPRSWFRLAPDLALPTLPAVEARETEKDFRLTAELPGIDVADIEVKLSNGSLTIRGEKRSDKESAQGECYIAERSYGSFERTLPVPPGVERDAIEATFDKGVLTVVLPKTAEAQQPAKTIEVKAA